MSGFKNLLVCAMAVPVMAVGAQRTDAILLPGLDEGNGAVGWWAYVLNGTGNYDSRTVDALNSSSSIPTQTSTVGTYLSSNGFGTNAILVGHSQGGLVARYAARSTGVLGVLTVATPNAGAPIADPFAASFLLGQEAMAGLDLFDINRGLSLDWSPCESCSQTWYRVTTYLTDAAALVGTVFEVIDAVPFLFSNPYYTDMQPTSAWITSLVQNPGLEQASFREAIAVDVVDYAAAPWRAGFSQGTADAFASLTSVYGLDLVADGMSIYNDATNDCWDPDACGDIMQVGNSMVLLGDQLLDVPFVMNYDVIGGIPNDALVPTGAESLPDKPPFRTVTDLNHVEILNDGQDIVNGANAVSGHP